MALLNNTDLEGKFNHASTGLFKTNTVGAIGSDDARALVEDLTDSYVNKVEDIYTSYSVTASGTDTYTATPSPALTAYAANTRFFIKFTNANTGAATLNLNALGAIAIKKSGTTALSSGDIAAGQVLQLLYDGTNFQVVGGGGGGGGGAWGSITGTLSSQTDLQTALNAKAALASPTFTGTPAAPTAAAATNTTQIATTAFVQQEIASVGSSSDESELALVNSMYNYTQR
jgi:hypothetical protein